MTKPFMMVSSAVRAALAAWVVRGAKMFLTTLRDAVPGRSASEAVSRMAEPSPRAAVTVVCAQISMVWSPYVPCGSRLDLKLPVDGVVVGARGASHKFVDAHGFVEGADGGCAGVDRRELF